MLRLCVCVYIYLERKFKVNFPSCKFQACSTIIPNKYKTLVFSPLPASLINYISGTQHVPDSLCRAFSWKNKQTNKPMDFTPNILKTKLVNYKKE